MADPVQLLGPCPCGKHDLSDPTNAGELCGAVTRQELSYDTCHRPAGWGTPDGRGPYKKCKLHGGSSLITTGQHVGKAAKRRYGVDVVKRPRVAELIEQFENDEDPLNILPELAAARAIFVDFVERYDEWRDGLLAWHSSYGKEGATPKPQQILDVSAAMGHVDTITKIAEREWKRHEANAISRRDLYRILGEWGKGVMKHVTDEETLKKIRAEWVNVTI